VSRRGLVSAVAAATASAVAGAFLFTASASHLPVSDPDDTKGLYDVREVNVRGTEKPRWKVITWREWTTAEVFDYGFSTIYIDTFGTPRPDYYILVGSLGSRLFAELFRDRVDRKDIDLGAVSRIGRSDKSSFYVRIRLRRMRVGANRALFRWRVETMFTGEHCRRVCFDHAPDTGTVVEPLPIPTPTVTPTPTPSPTSSQGPKPKPTHL
jgi:hypothetical protein